MNRKEQLLYCKRCTNKKNDFQRGIICGLTNEPATFTDSCESFESENGDTGVSEKEILLEASRKERLHNLEDAHLIKRLANYIIDIVAILILSFIMGILMAITLVFISPESLYIFHEENPFANYFLSFTIMLFYYTLSEAASGRTLGKLITRTKVVDENGMKPSFKKTLQRSLCRFIPFEFLSCLSGHGWHDTIPKTRVVNVRQKKI